MDFITRIPANAFTFQTQKETYTTIVYFHCRLQNTYVTHWTSDRNVDWDRKSTRITFPFMRICWLNTPTYGLNFDSICTENFLNFSQIGWKIIFSLFKPYPNFNLYFWPCFCFEGSRDLLRSSGSMIKLPWTLFFIIGTATCSFNQVDESYACIREFCFLTQMNVDNCTKNHDFMSVSFKLSLKELHKELSFRAIRLYSKLHLKKENNVLFMELVQTIQNIHAQER